MVVLSKYFFLNLEIKFKLNLQAKVDKETAQKIKEAAVAVKEGAQEVKSVGDSIKETISSSAGNVISHFLKINKLFFLLILLFKDFIA